MKALFRIEEDRVILRGAGTWLLGMLASVVLVSAGQAATRYWDIDGSVVGAGGATPSGIWSSSSLTWNQNGNGNSSFNTFGSGDDAIFSAGTDATGAYTVTVSGTQNVSSITIQEGAPEFTGGTINFSDATPAFTINTGITLNWGSTAITATGNGAVNVSGGGVLNFTQDLGFSGTMNLGGGTLRLTDADLTLGTLNITANSVIEFAGSASSLNVSTLNISAGVTVTINGWTENVDYFYAQNWTGATREAGGAPMNRIVFAGWTGADTRWRSFDNQISVVPEPGMTGLFTLGSLTLCFANRRRRSA